MPSDFQPMAYQCADVEAVPRSSLTFPFGTLTIMQLWSVLAPLRPALHTEARVFTRTSSPAFEPSAFRAPCEPVSTRIVDKGEPSGSSFFTASQLSNFSCKIQRPPH